MSDLRDDENISPDTVFYVRVSKEQLTEKNSPEGPRPSSHVFDDSTDENGVSGASIIFKHLLEDAGGKIADAVVNPDRFGLVELTVRDVREFGQGVVFDPKPNTDQHHRLCGPAHGLICGPKQKSKKRNIAKRARWIVLPPLT